MRDYAASIGFNHFRYARKQISQIVGQIGVVTGNKRILAVVGILAKSHVPNEEISEWVDAVFIGQLKRLDHITQRF